jgi:hypothetical protein
MYLAIIPLQSRELLAATRFAIPAVLLIACIDEKSPRASSSIALASPVTTCLRAYLQP